MRKVLSILLTFVLLLSLAPQTKANNVGFKDVPKSHPNYTEIMYLLEKGVIEPAEKFGVNQKVTREEVAIMVAKAIGLDGKKTKTKFKDVPESRYSSGYINSAVRAGIINGYPDGTFKPTQQVTRGHMAAFIANAFKLTNQADIKFKDIPKGSTSYVAVRKLAAANITSGYPDGTFKPNEGLSRAHISAFLARAMDPAFRRASESYYGEWIINQVQAYGVGTYSSEDAESLLGKSLTFTANKASYFGDKPSDIVKVATNPIYTETIIPESDFVEKHRIPFDLLGLKAPITEINVSDSKGHVSTFFIKDDNTLIISGGGTYFELIRKVSTDNEILIIIDQTPKPIEGNSYSFDFVVKQVPEGFALAEMQWITQHTLISDSVQDAIEHGANGEHGFYISGDGQFSGFIYLDYMRGEEGEVVFLFKDAHGNELTWKKKLTLENRTVTQEPVESSNVIENKNTETDSPSISIGKINKYEGMEITDWFDEQTVVLSKENEALEKMSLLENSEFYPRSIYLYNLDTKEYKTVKAQKNMFLGGAILSPDKKHLLYSEYSIGDVAYYLMSMDAVEQSPVTEDNLGIAYTAEWTDDQHVIGASYAGGAFMADTNRNITPITELSEEQLFTVQKIKDKIYYITTDSPSFQLYMLDLVTKKKKNLKVENADGITLSPDGKQMLITQGTESTRRLLVADAEGNVLRTIAKGSEVTGASWSPNQQMIAYQLKSSINGVDTSGIYLYDVLTDKTVQIMENVGAAKIRWSPSNKKIAITELNERNNNSSIIYLKYGK